MTRTLNITGYNPEKMGSGSLINIAFPFHKEANWYEQCCTEYKAHDYYAKLYKILGDKDLSRFWTDLKDCFEKVKKLSKDIITLEAFLVFVLCRIGITLIGFIRIIRQ